jgi:hypothetical protein
MLARLLIRHYASIGPVAMAAAMNVEWNRICAPVGDEPIR